VLWSGGIGFGGVIAFVFADLIVIPIVLIYRKYYGTRFAIRIVALMFVTIVIVALIVDGLFSGLGLIPHLRPSRGDIFGKVKLDYKLITNILGLAIFATLFAMTMRRGATDPVCRMKVDRAKSVQMDLGGRTYYFCSPGCLQAFETNPDQYRTNGRAAEPKTAHGHH
jgi:YHS domain-containing protein